MAFVQILQFSVDIIKNDISCVHKCKVLNNSWRRVFLLIIPVKHYRLWPHWHVFLINFQNINFGTPAPAGSSRRVLVKLLSSSHKSICLSLNLILGLNLYGKEVSGIPSLEVILTFPMTSSWECPRELYAIQNALVGVLSLSLWLQSLSNNLLI